MRDLAAAQAAGEARVAELDELLEREDAGEDVSWPADVVAPYDGCTTCQVREALAAALAVLES